MVLADEPCPCGQGAGSVILPQENKVDHIMEAAVVPAIGRSWRVEVVRALKPGPNQGLIMRACARPPWCGSTHGLRDGVMRYADHEPLGAISRGYRTEHRH